MRLFRNKQSKLFDLKLKLSSMEEVAQGYGVLLPSQMDRLIRLKYQISRLEAQLN